jgi:SnoaL-like domain
MTTSSIAEDYVSLCRQGRFDDAMSRLLSNDVVRVEPLKMTGALMVMRGIDAIAANSRGFGDVMEVHAVEVDGPFVGGDRFAVRFAIDATVPATGTRTTITKMELNTVDDGKVVRNEIFYNANDVTFGE